MLRTLTIAGLALIAGLGAAPAPEPTVPAAAPAPTAAPAPVVLPGVAWPTRTMLPVKDVMRHIVNPAAELYWKAAGEEDTEQGTIKRVPSATDNARWGAALDAAMTLQEAGNLLMMQGRARDNDRWMKYAQQLTDAGALAIKAAEARDEKQTFDAGSALYNACFACHGRYIPRPANSLYGHKTKDEDFKPPM